MLDKNISFRLPIHFLTLEFIKLAVPSIEFLGQGKASNIIFDDGFFIHNASKVLGNLHQIEQYYLAPDCRELVPIGNK